MPVNVGWADKRKPNNSNYICNELFKFKKIDSINADEIAKEFDPNDIEKYKIKAGKEFFKRLEMYLTSNHESFIIETTLSGFISCNRYRKYFKGKK